MLPSDDEQRRRREIATKGSVNKSYEFWNEFRPEVTRLHAARTPHYYRGDRSAVPALACLHQYVIRAFADGIGYEMRLARSRGATREDILDVLSIAFIHGGHVGMYAVSRMTPFLRDFEPISHSDRPFPTNWAFDGDAFRSGMDFSNPDVTHEDLDALTEWYERTIGETPAHVTFLARYRPTLLKAHRQRYETAIQTSLPKQMMPFLLLHHDVYRGFAGGIRENVLLARAFGLTQSQVVDAISSALLHAGPGALDLVNDVATDLIETFPR